MPYSLKEGLVTCFFTEKKSKTKKNDDVVDSPTILTFPTGALSADERSQVSMALQASNISEKKYDKRVFYSVAGLPFQTVAVAAGPTDESSVFYRSDNIRTSVT